MARIWRTADGRHVTDGHPDAAFLAYADGDQVPEDVLAEVEDKPKRRGRPPGSKSRPKPDDKQAAKPDDKGGLTINRLRDKDK
jgi:hypothetical protein